MEYELYRTVLILGAVINFLIAFALLHNNVYFSIYDVYHRSRSLVALNYTIFGIGFLLHVWFGWRISCPAAASALTVSYFHSGGVLFGWSHISLMPRSLNPCYRSCRILDNYGRLGFLDLFHSCLIHSFYFLSYIFQSKTEYRHDAC